MEHDLIFDVGMHDCADTGFNLRRAFRVIAVEADPDLCRRAEPRISRAIADQRLVVVNRAIAAVPGRVSQLRSSN